MLGIDVLSDESGSSMTQPFLINRIIKALKFDSTTTKGARDNIPAGYPLLNKDIDGITRKVN